MRDLAMDYAEKMQRIGTGMGFREYVEALEEERRKILVFQRELPFCLELVNQAIESCKQQLSGTSSEYLHGGQSECSEQTSSDVPVLEEFIPIKGAASEDFDDEDQQPHESRKENSKNSDKQKAGQADWLRSAQLWNQTPDPPKEDVTKGTSTVEAKRNGGAFQPFQRDKPASKTNPPESKVPSTAPAASTSSTVETASGDGVGVSQKEEKEGQTHRKQRRCWSPELHRRFLHALQQLGGSHVATPKQIRELMKVDGLTNDEVKSHLQKYRLHTRRPTPAIPNNSGTQAPQFVVVGGIWVPPPPDYTAAAAGTTVSSEVAGVVAAGGVYASVATPPSAVSKPSSCVIHRPKPKGSDRTRSEERALSHGEEGGAHSISSPATSSSTHITTASPVS